MNNEIILNVIPGISVRRAFHIDTLDVILRRQQDFIVREISLE